MHQHQSRRKHCLMQQNNTPYDVTRDNVLFSDNVTDPCRADDATKRIAAYVGPTCKYRYRFLSSQQRSKSAPRIVIVQARGLVAALYRLHLARLYDVCATTEDQEISGSAQCNCACISCMTSLRTINVITIITDQTALRIENEAFSHLNL